jgi:hypothetical protein
MGVVANRDINTGELIMEEPPLLSFSTATVGGHEVYEDILRSEVGKLSPEKQELFLGLGGHQRRTASGKVVDSGSSFSVSDASDEEIDTGLNTFRSYVDIFRTNAYPMSAGNQGLFPTLARMNNNCTPNAHYNWDEARYTATIYAVKGIKAGDEIVSSYMGLYFPRRDRLRYLSQNFGFMCNCLSCSLTGREAMESDNRRAMLAGLESMAATAIEKRDRDLALSVAEHRLKMLEEEGLSNPATLFKCQMDVFHAVSGLAKDAVPAKVSSSDVRDRDDALLWLTQAYDNAVLSKGAKSSAALRCLAFLTALQES